MAAARIAGRVMIGDSQHMSKLQRIGQDVVSRREVSKPMDYEKMYSKEKEVALTKQTP